jgi:hypothetical protein
MMRSAAKFNSFRSHNKFVGAPQSQHHRFRKHCQAVQFALAKSGDWVKGAAFLFAICPSSFRHSARSCVGSQTFPELLIAISQELSILDAFRTSLSAFFLVAPETL